MTGLSAPAIGRPAAGLRPVPWRKLAWVTWRQHRLALAAALALLGGLSVWMLINGVLVRSAMNSLGFGCRPTALGSCATLLVQDSYAGTANFRWSPS